MSVYDNGLIAYYPFDGNLRDVSSNQYDAIGASLAYQTGKHNEGILFDGNSSYVQLPDACSVKGLAAASICLWFKPAALTQTDDTLLYVEYTSSSSYTRFGLEITPDYKISFLGRDTNNGSILKALGQTALELDQWYLICGVYDSDNNQMSLYINGVLDGELSGSFGPFTATASADFSRLMRPSANRFVPGMIDEFSLWNKALTAAEVVELYNNGNGLFYGQEQPNPSPGFTPPADVCLWLNPADAVDGGSVVVDRIHGLNASGNVATGAINGVKSFKLTADGLSIANNTILDHAGSYHIFAVLWFAPWSGEFPQVIQKSSADGNVHLTQYQLAFNNAMKQYAYCGPASVEAEAVSSAAILESVGVLYETKVIYDGTDTSVQLIRSGVITDSAQTSGITPNISADMKLLVGNVSDLLVGDIIICNTDTSEETIAAIRKYFTTKYGVTSGQVPDVTTGSGSALALLPSGIPPNIGDPGVVIGNYFIPIAKPD